MEGEDHQISATNDDASIAKYSASRIGYFEDKFITIFLGDKKIKMPPLINRGYYTRVSAVRLLMDQFLLAGGKQIVSFGAGFDTNYFRLKDRKDNNPQALVFEKYFEIDFPHVVKQKLKIIKNSSDLTKWIANPQYHSMNSLNSDNYCIFGADLRDLSDLENKLKSFGVNFDYPTLFLSECVLIYINPTDSANLIRWTSKIFNSSIFIIYEQIHPNDSFGQVMIKNLETRGVPLASFKAYPDIPAQKKRMLDLGYTNVEVLDMNQIFKSLLEPSENQRISRIEIFDEFEEWFLIQGHYCIVLATQDKSNTNIWKNISLTRKKDLTT